MWDDIIDKHNNTYHKVVTMKLVDVDSDTCVDFDVGNDDGDSKFKVGVMLEWSKC